MQPEEVLIVLPLPDAILSPNRTVGSIGGRYAKAAAIKRYREFAKKAIEEARIKSAPWAKILVKAIFYFSCNRKRDQDNAMSSLKSAYDGIVDSGLVADDDYKHMLRDTPEFLIDKFHPRVELEITRIIGEEK